MKWLYPTGVYEPEKRILEEEGGHQSGKRANLTGILLLNLGCPKRKEKRKRVDNSFERKAKTRKSIL